MSKKYNFYADGGSTGLPAGAEQHYVNHYLNEGASAGVFEQGGSLVDGYLTDPNFGDFQAGIYNNGGQIDTKNVTIAKRIKVKKWYLKTYPKDDLGKEIREDITFWSLWAYMSQGYDVYNILGVGDSMIRERVFEELSKILGVDYDVVYQKWLNSDEYAGGGEIEFQHSNLRIVGTGIDKNGNRVVKVSFPNQRPFSIQTNGNLPKTHSLLKDYDKKNTNFYKGEIESMEDEILDYIEKYGSENQKKSVRVYGSWLNKDDYAEGGSLGNHGLKQGDQIIKTMSGGVQKVKTRTGDIVYVNLANGYRGAEPPLPFKNGGVTKNYIDRNQLNTITIKKGDQKLTYKVSDVYNGAYKLEEGGNLEKTAFYVSKRNVVKVQLKNGKDVKVANGYWIKKGAKPISASKFEDGGDIEYENGGAFGEVAFIVTNDYFGNLELGFYNVPVNEQYTSYKAFMKYSDALNGLLKFLNSEDGEYMVKNNLKSKFEIEMVSYNSKLDKYKDLEPQRKVVFSLKSSMVKDFFNKNIFEDGGQLEMKFAGGGKIETKIQKKVDEVNALIEKAVDSDGDPLMVVDTTGTWEEPMQYKPIFYKNGRLYIEYFEPYSGKTEKDVINKSNMDFDGYPTLLNIAKMYRKALKEKGISYAGGGKTTFKEKATAIAKNFEGKKVEPKYQKEYGKTYDKAEAKEVGNKIAGSQKAKYDNKMSGGGSTKRGGSMVLAKQIRKEGESWASAMKRANEQIKNK